jgi:hypothetical protein
VFLEADSTTPISLTTPLADMDRLARARCPRCRTRWPVFRVGGAARAGEPEVAEVAGRLGAAGEQTSPRREASGTSTALILTANPDRTTWIRLDREHRGIQEELDRARYREELVVQARPAVKIGDLQYSILSVGPTILHFCGHGAKPGIIVEDDAGKPYLVPGEALAELLAMESVRADLRLVVLNACLSADQAELIARHISGVVVGMSVEVGDDPAIEFAKGLYRAIGAGANLDEAFNIARNAVRLTRSMPEAAIPQMFVSPYFDAKAEALLPLRADRPLPMHDTAGAGGARPL